MRHLVSHPFSSLLFIVLAFGVLAVLASSAPSPAYVENGRINVDKAELHWHARIDSVGNRTAYEEMLSAGKALSIPEAHTLAHTFGGALFESTGLEGASVCGDDYIWGCYHQYVGSVLASHGAESAPKLYDACKAAYGEDLFGCEHGLGHGLLGFYGYDSAGLDSALTVCDTLDIRVRSNGCYDGVFMEFNERELTATGTSLVNPRPFAPEHRYEPCLGLKERYRDMCVRELPIWWGSQRDFAFRDDNDIYEKLGGWCHALPDDARRAFCFRGIGHVAVQGTDTTLFSKRCDAATDDPLYNLHCRTFAARRMDLLAHEERSSAELCGIVGLERSLHSYCMQNLEGNREVIDTLMDMSWQEIQRI